MMLTYLNDYFDLGCVAEAIGKTAHQHLILEKRFFSINVIVFSHSFIPICIAVLKLLYLVELRHREARETSACCANANRLTVQ